jgi:hypothetical protein
MPPPTTAPDARLALLVEQLCRAIAARGPASGLAQPLLVLAWAWLRRTTMRFARLAERLRTGRLGTPRPRRRPATGPRPQSPRPKRLPRAAAWLARLVPEARCSAAQLQHLLEGPEMAALIAAAPQAGRLLRPLCRMLGVDHPPLRRPRRPRPPPAAAHRPAPPAAASPAATVTPRGPARSWLLRTSLPGRRRPGLVIPGAA